MAKSPNIPSTPGSANPLPTEIGIQSLLHTDKGNGVNLTFFSLSDPNAPIPETGEKSGEYYANAKGFDVAFPRSESSGGGLVKGKLVEDHDPEKFVVVAIVEEDQLLKKEFSAEALYDFNPGLREMVAQSAVSADIRRKLTSVLEDYERSKPVTSRMIDTGGNAETLEASMRTFEFPGGIEGVAATSLAGYKYPMLNDAGVLQKAKDINEDRWVVDPDTGFVAVVDGIGGGQSGSYAASIVSEAIAANENDVPAGALAAQRRLNATPEIKSSDGACFLSARIEVGKPIDITQCGDIDCYHFDATGEIKYEPGNQLELGQEPQSAFEYFDQLSRNNVMGATLETTIRQMADVTKKTRDTNDERGLKRIIDRIVSRDFPIVETSNPMYSAFRKMVVNAVTKGQVNTAHFATKKPVAAGDWILIMSDGVSDNFTEEEIQSFVRWAIAGGVTPETATRKLSQALDERIKLKAKNDPLAEQHHLKLDNATIILMRVKQPATKIAAVAA